MRTTLTLDPDVVHLVEEEVHRQRRPFKQVINDAIRRGLAPSPASGPSRPFRTTVHKAKLRPGVDPGSLNSLADETEDEAIVAKAKKGRRR